VIFIPIAASKKSVELCSSNLLHTSKPNSINPSSIKLRKRGMAHVSSRRHILSNLPPITHRWTSRGTRPGNG